MDAHDHPEKGVDVLQLLAGEGQGNVVEPGAAILLRDGKSRMPARLAEHFGVELTLASHSWMYGATWRAANSRTVSRT